MIGIVAFMHLEADDLATVDVEYQVQITPYSGNRAGTTQCTGDDFRGRLREPEEVCPAYSCADWRRLISGKTSSMTELSAITLPKAASSRSSS